ncbi:D-2-hydroxyacid dehydrogenase [Pararhodonellum marinum]|uniref:D-2-hydroxyacid dehydrogenase n=1 Tax=Pararhodonellum marinum TaxID=2755358 RepID=UPI00188FB4DF|nr:D-2-hydroxyacid dehydrogenase [Pararhodonellum marinum]
MKKATQNGLLLGSAAVISPNILQGATHSNSEIETKRLPLRIWLASGLSKELEQKLKAISPEITLFHNETNSSNADFLSEIDVCFGRISESELAKAKNLKWVHSSSAGVEKQLFPAMLKRQEIQMSNAKGCYGPAIAEHTFGLLFALTRGIKEQALNMPKQEWKGVSNQIEMRNLTMGIIGFGGIGREIARRAKAMDLRVLAADIRPMTQETTGNLVDELHDVSFGGLEKVLEKSNIIVSAVPHTKQTEDMFDMAAFQKMPKNSYFINISRGKVAKTTDLMKALESGHLAGAGLDVTDPEPLPKDHALWDFPNVIITSHISGRSQYSSLRSQEVFVENVNRYVAGLPLINAVDKEAGF